MSGDQRIVPFGSWTSSLSATAVARGDMRLGSPRVQDDEICWWETRPAEDGRCVVVRRRNDGSVAVLPQPYSARTRVHEYGGRSFDCHDGTVYFTNFTDQAIYAWQGDGTIRPITQPSGTRYCDMAIDRQRGRILAVAEEHSKSGAIVNRISAIDITSGDEHVIASGNDFYTSPRLSPDGRRLAWITWNHPRMPWDSTELWVASLDAAGAVVEQHLVSGAEGDRALCEPSWSPAGELYVVSDHTNWWNLYRVHATSLLPVAPMEAECTFPQWWMGVSHYAFIDDLVVLAAARNAISSLYVVAPGGQPRVLELPFTDIGSLGPGSAGRVLALAGGPANPLGIVSIDIRTGKWNPISPSAALPLESGDISAGQPVSGPTRNGAMTHGLLYRPANHSVTSPDGPFPLIVRAHGGPTLHATNTFDSGIQFWTTRGFGFLDVNYGGSTGYGRVYRMSLQGQYGILDNTDCIDLALHLAEQGIVDKAKLFITGGSAGGYVVLCCLAFHDVFAAGTSYYGISDLEMLAEDTHKFEARYLDGLVGDYPKERETYRVRSPRHFAHKIRRPVLMLQGLDDKIVPPNQAEAMFRALRANQVPCAYITFEGEQHGFRQEANIKRALEAELSFYQQILQVPHSPDVPLVEVEGLAPTSAEVTSNAASPE